MEQEIPDIDALGELAKEHQVALSHLDVLQEALAGLRDDRDEAGVPVKTLSVAEGVMRDIETELGSHLRKEEQVLFPALSDYLPREGGPRVPSD